MTKAASLRFLFDGTITLLTSFRKDETMKIAIKKCLNSIRKLTKTCTKL